MGISVSVSQVKNIVINSDLTNDQIEGCISTATVMVLSYLGEVNMLGALRNEICAYLAAHFVALHDRTIRLKSEKMGDASVEYDVSKSEAGLCGLRSTSWGATAIQLDPSGILQQLGLKKPRLVYLNELV